MEMLGLLDGWAEMGFGNTQREIENKFIKIMLILVNEKEEKGKKERSSYAVIACFSNLAKNELSVWL